jgi:hypothetical protein
LTRGAEHARGFHLQQDRLRGNAHGRDGDLVAGPEIREAPHAVFARDQAQRLRRTRRDPLHAAARAVPQQQQIAGPGVDDIDGA